MDKKDNSVSDSRESPFKVASNGMPIFASKGSVITPEMIKQAEEEDLNDEIERMFFVG
ncbi:MAG TPA: hypothetical protein VGU46_06150 [Acidobacteriaceae bacterium]|nr:hypothetical protein [Acidobacteriaceae bacterium]